MHNNWCLKEASLIARQVLLQGKDEDSAFAVPLFDNLTPAQIRHPGTGPIWQPSGRYSAKEIGEWKDAVFQLCLVSVWSLQEDTNRWVNHSSLLCCVLRRRLSADIIWPEISFWLIVFIF